jgi:Putative beta-barrel porin-2, OmpL-like. bbp2
MNKWPADRSVVQLVLTCMFLVACATLHAQDSTRPKALTFSGYVEVYYSYDLGKPPGHERPAFFYNYNRHHEVNLNLGFIKAAFSRERVRGNFAVMAGTYAQYNLALEPGLLKNIFEANAGFKISQKNNVWIDAGIMPSHIGFESAIGKDCWVLTRSIMAENTPYYEAGIRAAYTSRNEKLYLALMYLNGWQRIQRINGNNTTAWGSQLTYKPTTMLTLNWSTYVGNEQPDSLRLWRYFNNLYAIAELNEKSGLILGADIGIQQRSKGSSRFNSWFSPILIARYAVSNKLQLAGRAEYYADKNAVIITTVPPAGFKTWGFSVNMDYRPTGYLTIRLEARTLKSEDNIFTLNKRPANTNHFITSSIALAF